MFHLSALRRSWLMLKSTNYRPNCSGVFSGSVNMSTNNDDDNPLLKELITQIKVSGPLTVSDYMKQALLHPQYGFYMKPVDVFGKKGHFITSPEVSQIFGELIAIWIMYNWQQYSESQPLEIIELGPGRGTLALDLARSMAQFFEHQKQTCSFSLVEISPFLRKLQWQKLCNADAESASMIESSEQDCVHYSRTIYDQSISWYPSIDQLLTAQTSKSFKVFVANEFFDAFPIHKFTRESTATPWREMLIDYDPNQEKKLRWIKAKHETPMSKVIMSQYTDATYGDHFEFSPQTLVTLKMLVKHFHQNQSLGCILICDYGFDEQSDPKPINRDTLRAYCNHIQCDPLDRPGMVDLTADVDFGTLKQSLSDEPCCYHGTVTQRDFLTQMGIQYRLKKLLQSTKNDPQAQNELISSVKMLLEDMGERFKFMSIFSQAICDGQNNKATGEKNENNGDQADGNHHHHQNDGDGGAASDQQWKPVGFR